MKSTDLRKGNDLARTRRPFRTRLGTVFSERQVRPGSMVIIEVGGKDLPQVMFVQDDDVVQTFAHDSFNVRILPRGSGSNHDVLDARGGNCGPESSVVNTVSVPDQLPRLRVPVPSEYPIRRRIPGESA